MIALRGRACPLIALNARVSLFECRQLLRPWWHSSLPTIRPLLQAHPHPKLPPTTFPSPPPNKVVSVFCLAAGNCYARGESCTSCYTTPPTAPARTPGPPCHSHSQTPHWAGCWHVLDGHRLQHHSHTSAAGGYTACSVGRAQGVAGWAGSWVCKWAGG